MIVLLLVVLVEVVVVVVKNSYDNSLVLLVVLVIAILLIAGSLMMGFGFMGGMMGYGSYGTNVFASITWLLVVVVIISLVAWLIKRDNK